MFAVVVRVGLENGIVLVGVKYAGTAVVTGIGSPE